jgi:hypothetical protein
VLRLVRSIKNNFAPTSRVPPELFSIVARYLDQEPTEKTLIALTHVCQGWREVFTTYSPLWTRLDCTNVDKTRAYIERSKSSPLEIVLYSHRARPYQKDAFHLVLPHISRVRSITIAGGNDLFNVLTTHFSCPVPLLRNLDLEFSFAPLPVLNGALFNGDLSSLRKLKLCRIDPHLPWKNLQKLTSFSLRCIPGEKISITQLLDLFENSTFLSEIKLGSMPASSDAPPGRVVALPHLKHLSILTDSRPSSNLLDHLSILPGVYLHQEFVFPYDDNTSLLRTLLPKTSHNLQNISHITSVYLDFDEEDVIIQLSGPSGKLYISGQRDRWSSSAIPDRILLQSLDNFVLSRVQELRVTMYELSPRRGKDASYPCYILSAMEDLRTLFLNKGNILPFFLALNPSQHPSELVLCPKLESLVLYVESQWFFGTSGLVAMAKERASRGVKLESVTWVNLDEPPSGEEAQGLREYVTRVEHRFEKHPPRWDILPGDQSE